MNRDFEQLQNDYIEALRPVVADALRWWDAHCPYPHTDPRPFDEMAPFHRRWMAGPAAHPRVLAVLREYWFRVLGLNEHLRPQERPIDLLVDDLSTIAPDLFDVMQGIVYIPIGTNPQNGEEF